MESANRKHGFTHMGVAKSAVISWLHRYGVAEVLPNFEGTLEEAIEAIKNDPREFFEHCENTDATGRCQGHLPTGATNA